jgi:hypothetical protein
MIIRELVVNEDSGESNYMGLFVKRKSLGPSCKFVAEAKLNNLVYFLYTLPAVCIVQLINTWRQAGIKGFVDYSEIEEEEEKKQIDRSYTDTQGFL